MDGNKHNGLGDQENVLQKFARTFPRQRSAQDKAVQGNH